MRVVFDTVILVRGLINPSSWCGRIVFGYAGTYELIVSRAIVAEYEEVLVRPELVRKYRGIAASALDEIMEIVSQATVVQPQDVPTICRDPADDKFLAAAKAASAGYIVTEDLDLLDMATWADISIVSAATFLTILQDE